MMVRNWACQPGCLDLSSRSATYCVALGELLTSLCLCFLICKIRIIINIYCLGLLLRQG